ncbi:hypothetical protein RRG08_031071 [Elysia crispata]|uniref:Uncharacterized protein n=1 Tax=Elysia crispata TaxID=231223 RepID=A0AAE0ZF51_9GAST|nr:hypothetical protein RRG08_031071 [Elysia crispata]
MILHSEKFAKYSCLVGVHFIIAPHSFIWVYGNLAEYMDSYVRYSSCDGCNDGDTQWTLPLYMACFCPGLFLVDPLVRRIGLKRTGILSMLLFNSSLLGSAWTIQFSVVGTIVLQGLVMGMSVSVSVCLSYMYIHSWRPKYEALLLASVSCSANMLAMIENQLITEVVNPKNLQPNTVDGPKMFFSQQHLLKQVPKAILTLGGIILGLQTVGYLLVSAPRDTDQESTTLDQHDLDPRTQAGKPHGNVSNSAYSKLLGDNKNGIHETNHKDNNCISDKCRKDQSLSTSTDLYKSLDVESNREVTSGTDRDSDQLNSEVNHISNAFQAMDIMRTSNFWVLWLSWVALIYGLMLKNCFYKQFGFLYISNDKNLTLLGTFSPLLTSIARIAFGYCMDKGIVGVKGSLVISLSFCSVLSAFWFWAPQVSEAVYASLILCLASMLGALYVVFPAAIHRIFGPAQFSLVLAMLYSASTVVGLTVAVCATPFLNSLGWFWIFASSSFISLVALACVIVANLDA